MTDALGRTVTLEMDSLGRVETRTDTLGAQVSITSWIWDTAPHGIGRLQSVVSPDGVKTYSYNKRGQTESIKLAVANDAFAARLGYDEFGRMNGIDYPQPLGEAPFGVAYDYDAHGFRIAVRDKATRDAFWELKYVDSAGRYAEESFGNGNKTVRGYDNEKQALKSITTTKGASTIQQLSYDWDEQLNLKSRTDALQPQNKTERFRHDVLDRLTCAYFSPMENANAACNTSFGYAPNGNLWEYSPFIRLSSPVCRARARARSFLGSGFRARTRTRTGDAHEHGRRETGDARREKIPGKTSTFGYDGDQQRIRKTTSNSETLSFEDLFEQITTAGGKEFRYYVHSPERTIAIVTRGGNEPGTKYVHVDHLGSTETITKNDGKVDEKRSYDAFGARRHAQWGLPGGAFASKTKKGFTGHDEEDEFGLVNMKGRLYDPKIARFTTTDPVIANVYNGQSFAAYSYVLNNPLTFTDPSGFAPDKPPILPISSQVTTAADGSITVDLVYPPREGRPQKVSTTFLLPTAFRPSTRPDPSSHNVLVRPCLNVPITRTPSRHLSTITARITCAAAPCAPRWRFVIQPSHPSLRKPKPSSPPSIRVWPLYNKPKTNNFWPMPSKMSKKSMSSMSTPNCAARCTPKNTT